VRPQAEEEIILRKLLLGREGIAGWEWQILHKKGHQLFEEKKCTPENGYAYDSSTLYINAHYTTY